MVAVLARNADFCTVLTWLKFYFLQMALLVVIGITPRAPTTGTTTCGLALQSVHTSLVRS